MRFFIALEIPEQSQKELAKVQAQLKDLIPNFRLTEEDKLHLTIAFIGEQDERLKESLVEIINKAVDQTPAFEVTPAYMDGFPTLHHPHILWMGVKGDIDKIFFIRERVKDGLLSLNLDVDARRFVPHIALGKTSNFEMDPVLEDKIQRISEGFFDPIKVSSIKLFQSIPNHGFHQHNTLAEIKLV